MVETSFSPAGFRSPAHHWHSATVPQYTALCFNLTDEFPRLKMAAVDHLILHKKKHLLEVTWAKGSGIEKRAVIVLSRWNWRGLFLPCRVSPWCARRHPPLRGSCPSEDRHGIVTRCGVVKPCPVLWLARSYNKTNKGKKKETENWVSNENRKFTKSSCIFQIWQTCARDANTLPRMKGDIHTHWQSPSNNFDYASTGHDVAAAEWGLEREYN